MSQILHAHAAPPAAPLVDLLERAFSEGGLGALDRAGVATRVPRAAWEAALLGPARALLSRPGKGFRESLVRLCWSVAGGRGQMPPALPLIVEIIHAGSLVIDDVEDDSSLRRGGACLHRLYGVPIAINVGNWMYFWALDLVGDLGLANERAAALQRALTQGMFRCHFGQALDLSRPVGRIPQGEISAIVDAATALKTGALMELAARAGAIAAGAAPVVADALARFGRRLGRGLQMLDDLGNIAPAADGDDPTGTLGGFLEPPATTPLGKAQLRQRDPKRHEDLRLGRATWPWAWAAEALDEISFAALQADARVVHAQAAAGRPAATEALATALRNALGVQGRRVARQELARGLGELAQAVGPRPEIPDLTAEIARLEAAYG